MMDPPDLQERKLHTKTAKKSMDQKSPKHQNTRNMDCYYYYHSKCNNGERCTLRHEPKARMSTKECKFWKAGCTSLHCEFRHMDMSTVKKPLVKEPLLPKPSYTETVNTFPQSRRTLINSSTKNSGKRGEDCYYDYYSPWYKKPLVKEPLLPKPFYTETVNTFPQNRRSLINSSTRNSGRRGEDCYYDYYPPGYKKPLVQGPLLPKPFYTETVNTFPQKTSRKSDEDCYYYYYSTCDKGEDCNYRHESLARGREIECKYWKDTPGCMKAHCEFRHMDLKKQKNRANVQCYHEANNPDGCKKEFCPYKHKSNGHSDEDGIDKKKIHIIKWYWKDEDDNWVEYGETNTKNNSKSQFNSDDVEKLYQTKPQGTFDNAFTSTKGQVYTIDFANNCQKNVQFCTTRPIKRDVTVEVKKTQKKVIPTESGLLSHWNIMNDNDIYALVDIVTGMAEYNAVEKLYCASSSGGKCSRILRVQNPKLWKNFQNKKDEMLKMYSNDAQKVNEQQLFHGTNHALVRQICEENLDWRLNGIHGVSFGQGVYFAKNASYSRSYCKPSPNGTEYAMFLCRVLIGSVISGDSSMRRPPHNSATGHLYDTTVNCVTNPNIFVKYHDDSFYPEYVIYFTQ